MFSTYNPQATSSETTALEYQHLSLDNRFDLPTGVVTDSKGASKATSRSIKSDQPSTPVFESKAIKVPDATNISTQRETNQDVEANQSLPHPKSFPSSTPKLDVEAQFVIRKHYAKTLLTNLEKVQQFCGKPQAANYIAPLLNSILGMRDTIPLDPYVEVAMAFYDAIAYKDGWVHYRPEQYEEARRMLMRLSDKSTLNRGDVDRGLDKLDKLGFDSLPFSDNIDLFDELKAVDEDQ